MKKLSLVGILISLLGILIAFAITDNHVEFFDDLIQQLKFYDPEIRREIYKTVYILDFGTYLSFSLMGLFGFFLFFCLKIYRNED